MIKVSLKAARINAGLKQDEAAARIGIGLNTLARYEKSRLQQVKTVKKILDFYGLTFDDLKL